MYRVKRYFLLFSDNITKAVDSKVNFSVKLDKNKKKVMYIAYTIKQVSEITGLSVSTLRYYDKEGLLPGLKRRQSGYREFTDEDLETIKIINCFKLSGLKIKDMTYFMQLTRQGDSTLQERYDIYCRQVKQIEEKLSDMQKALEIAKGKCKYFKEALQDGTEARVWEKYMKQYNKDKD